MSNDMRESPTVDSSTSKFFRLSTFQIKEFLYSPTVLYRVPFVVPILIGKNNGSIAWMFWWCYVGIGIFGHFRKEISTPDFTKRLRKIHQPCPADSKGEMKRADLIEDQGDGSVKVTYSDGRVYRGKWSNDEKNGEGIETYGDGSEYSGNFLNNKAHGSGKMNYADKSTYTGLWKNGLYDGKGEWTAEDQKNSYNGEWKDGEASGQGVRTTALGNKFVGEFRCGKPHKGNWTTPYGATHPHVNQHHAEGDATTVNDTSTSGPRMSLVVALDMYVHVVIGLLIAYYIGYIKIWIFNLDMILMVPLVEFVVLTEQLLPKMKAMVPDAKPRNSDRSSMNFSDSIHIDAKLLEEFIAQSQNCVIDIDFEWMNYTLAQFWHTYEAWCGEYIRSLIEQSICTMTYINLETCTLGKSPITVTQLKAQPRNSDPKLREARALGHPISDEDLIVDLYINLDWRSDFKIKLKLFGLLPISVEDVVLTAPIRVVLQWLALDHRDMLSYPNLSYLALESVGRADLTLSLKLFGFFDLFSIPPLGTLLDQDYLLDVVYEALGPETGFWIDFIRGRPCGDYVILDSREAYNAAALALRNEVGDVKGVKGEISASKLQVSVTVASARKYAHKSPFCIVRMGKKAQVDAKLAPEIEKKTKVANKGTVAKWNAETFSWFCTSSTAVADADWLSITLMDSTFMGSKTVGTWKAALADVIHANDIVANGPPKMVTCVLKVEEDKSKKADDIKDVKEYPEVSIEINLISLGLSSPAEVLAGGKSLLDQDFRKEQESACMIHVQVKFCQNLHHRMNAKLRSHKIEPYIRLFLGSLYDIYEAGFPFSPDVRAALELGMEQAKRKFDRTSVRKDWDGLSSVLKRDSNLLKRIKQFQTKPLQTGSDFSLKEEDGKATFDYDGRAVDACLLVEVYHQDILLGSTFLETKDFVLDTASNKFVLKEAELIRVLCDGTNHVVLSNGEQQGKELWQGRPYEARTKAEVPMITLYCSLSPKINSRPAIKVTVLRAELEKKASWFSGTPDTFVIVSLPRGKARTNAEDDALSPLQRFQTGVQYNMWEPSWLTDNAFTLHVSHDRTMWESEELELVLMDHKMVGASKELGSWKISVLELFNAQKAEAGDGELSVPKDRCCALAMGSKKGGKLHVSISLQGEWT